MYRNYNLSDNSILCRSWISFIKLNCQVPGCRHLFLWRQASQLFIGIFLENSNSNNEQREVCRTKQQAPKPLQRLTWAWKGALKGCFSAEGRNLWTPEALPCRDLLSEISQKVGRSDFCLWHERPGLHHDPIAASEYQNIVINLVPWQVAAEPEWDYWNSEYMVTSPHYKECIIIQFVHPHIIGQWAKADKLGLFTQDPEPIA